MVHSRWTRTTLWALLTAALLVGVVRGCWLTIVEVGLTADEPLLHVGDCLLLNRWSYGLRIGSGDSSRYVLSQSPQLGDWVAVRQNALNLPNSSNPSNMSSSSPIKPSPHAGGDGGGLSHAGGEAGGLEIGLGSGLSIGRLMALPGDTVWMGYGGVVSSCRDYQRGCIWPLMVPARGSIVSIEPWTAELYARLIQGYEGVDVTIRDTALYIRSRQVKRYRFKHDFYWIQSASDTAFWDSRCYGPVPHESIKGSLVRILYSPTNKTWMHAMP